MDVDCVERSALHRELERLREQLARVTRERNLAVQVAVLVQTRGGRAQRCLSTEEALAIVLEWLSDPGLPVGALVAEAIAEHDRVREVRA